MIAVDTNILVYAHRKESEWHADAIRAIQLIAEGRESWAIPWPCVHEFLAIVTHPRIFEDPTPIPLACAQVDAWLESPSATLIGEDTGYWPILRERVMSSKVVGPRVHDARIAAICERHGVRELWTADRDFSRFKGLRVRNPLHA